MHDAIAVEKLGVPAVGVMTERFVTAADLMAKSQGAADFRYVTIVHPISSATETDLAEQARAAIAGGRGILTGAA